MSLCSFRYQRYWQRCHLGSLMLAYSASLLAGIGCCIGDCQGGTFKGGGAMPQKTTPVFTVSLLCRKFSTLQVQI